MRFVCAELFPNTFRAINILTVSLHYYYAEGNAVASLSRTRPVTLPAEVLRFIEHGCTATTMTI